MAPGAVTLRAIAAALALATLCASAPARAADTEGDAALLRSVDGYTPRMGEVADALWDWAELGYLEQRSAALLQDELRAAGFSIEAGVAGMPTAFVARAGRPGSGPVIALLAEMDALPGMGQAAVPRPQPLPGQAGHACGHNLFGAATVSAARALRDWLASSGTPGEIRVYGTPAEEGGSGKVYMVRAGLFDDVDAVLHWHPGDRNGAAQMRSMANISGRFRFEGVAAHASIAPERGRSALDGVEALNHMANLMREHVPADTRIHYTISDGGGAPNVVPASAEVWYYVRHPEPDVVRDVFARLQRAAEGAALGTGTRVHYTPVGGVYGLLPNDALGRVLDGALRSAGVAAPDADALLFARELGGSFSDAAPMSRLSAIDDYATDGFSHASTDVGDVSWAVPTAGLSTATWAPGTPAHSWQATAASGHALGHHGAATAARTLALAAARLYRDPALLQAARAELDTRRGAGFTYQPLLDRSAPPLDYRVTTPARP